MNKVELIAAVAEKSGLSKKDAEKAVSAVLDSVVEAVAKEDKVQLVGFGTFEVRARGERTGRNPAPRNRLSFRLPSSLFSRPARRLRTPWRNKVFISTICNCWQERGEEAECFLSIFISSGGRRRARRGSEGAGLLRKVAPAKRFFDLFPFFYLSFRFPQYGECERSFFLTGTAGGSISFKRHSKSGGNPQDSRRFLG